MSKSQQNWEPREVVVRHGLFWYFAKEKQVIPNTSTGRLEEQEVLVQRTADQNDRVTLYLESDWQRGIDHHAFWTDDELASTAAQLPVAELPEPAYDEEAVTGRKPSRGRSASASNAETADDEAPDPTEVNAAELDDEGLGDWLTGTGEFDGARKPNAGEVVDAIGDDQELAGRVLKAEKRTRGDVRRELQAHADKLAEDQG